VAVIVFRPPEGPFRSSLTVPGDKSMSHRALILAALAQGTSQVSNIGPGEDVAATKRALEALGVEFTGDRVRSPGAEAWTAPTGPIDAANSGTTMRVMTGALAAQTFRSTLVGDSSLMRRPMARLVAPLRALGASVEVGPEGCPPVTVGGSHLRGAAVEVSNPSAQVRSAVAFAALQAEGHSTIDSPPGFRDHTERLFEALALGRRLSATRFEISPGPVPTISCPVPGDVSSAAFLLAAAALRPGSELTVTGVTLNPGRLGFIEVLEAMGARVARQVTGMVYGDPVGDLSLTAVPLSGARVAGALTLRTLDELPLVAILATAAEGETVVSGAGELRVKESDRIAAAVAMVRALGGSAEELPDGFVVVGGGPLAGGAVHSAGDHRIAMAAAVAAVTASGAVTVEAFEAASVSWPGFQLALESMWS
jgi:3-phosphoshikimate 1-carboxyvinyltransferase